jgi:protein-S-isoprenylcysteine O-methyltransferase Ste14
MFSAILLFLLTLGIIAVRIFWILTEPGSFTIQLKNDFLKTNATEVLILALQVLSAIYFPWPATRLDGFFVIFGTTLYVIGMILAIWARLTMRQIWGHPGEHNIKRQNKLVTQGPFSLSRNPIYVGFLLIYFGYGIAVRTWFIVLRIPLLIYFYRSILKEEKNLEKYFGKTYKTYKTQVPRFLIV